MSRAITLLSIVAAVAAWIGVLGVRDGHAIAASTNGTREECARPVAPPDVRRAIVRAFPEAPLTALRVSCCESGFRVTAVSRTDDLGAMQVNVGGRSGRSLAGRWFSRAELLTLDGNLQAARILFVDNGRRFTTTGHWRWSAWCWNQ